MKTQGFVCITPALCYLCVRKRNVFVKIVADIAIPFIQGLLEPFAEVTRLPGGAIRAETVRDADALLVRTRTRCDENLLAGSRVRFVGTATIGFDHIDLAYCRRAGIRVAAAPGSNARGVLQYLGAVLAHLSRAQGWQPGERTLGIVGVGHVGSLVEEYARRWGFHVVCCDPPREKREHAGFLPLGEVARQADILTFHTPLDSSTRHMADRRLLDSTRPGCVIVNTSRGEVADTEALAECGRACVLDVWENEPHIDRRLLERALLATPHIAGYSAQGKANAASIVVSELSRAFGLPLEGWYPAEVSPGTPRPISWQELCDTIVGRFDIAAQSRLLKSGPENFERMRDHYRYREEYF